jgi:hypothetical protein
MPTYRNTNDTLEAEKIYCTFERSSNPRRISTSGRHNAQALAIDGNPATATIVKTLRFVKE